MLLVRLLSGLRAQCKEHCWIHLCSSQTGITTYGGNSHWLHCCLSINKVYFIAEFAKTGLLLFEAYPADKCECSFFNKNLDIRWEILPDLSNTLYATLLIISLSCHGATNFVHVVPALSLTRTFRKWSDHYGHASSPRVKSFEGSQPCLCKRNHLSSTLKSAGSWNPLGKHACTKYFYLVLPIKSLINP